MLYNNYRSSVMKIYKTNNTTDNNHDIDNIVKYQ